ncbi:MAG: caspase family protein [Bacteroidales bacterium]|nr:caspase family protein [Bacteroidales bacterium]
MKKVLFLFAAMLLVMTGANAQRTYVLAVGVAHYKDSANNLNHSDQDAIRMQKLMNQHYRDVTVMTSSYATHDGIMDRLRKICKQSKSKDRIVFYFSGHGFSRGIVGYDTFILFDELIRELQKAKAGTKICMIDACKSGAIVSQEGGTATWSSLAADTNTVFVLACRGEELSAESPVVGAGLFTNALLKALRGLADENQDKSITMEEMFRYVYGDVVKHSKGKQHPQLIATKRMRNSAFLSW